MESAGVNGALERLLRDDATTIKILKCALASLVTTK